MKLKQSLLNPRRLPSLRSKFHANICADVLGYDSVKQAYCNADNRNSRSIALAEDVASRIAQQFSDTPKIGDVAEALLKRYTLEFLRDAFGELDFRTPDKPLFAVDVAVRSMRRFDDYKPLAKLVKKLAQEGDLRATLGGDYLITPDITVATRSLTTTIIGGTSIASVSEMQTSERKQTRSTAQAEYKMLHASVSCKWIIRSDRSVSGRTEPLNLTRNRSGKKPYIAVVTFEPLPSRIASIAMGTGDIDCTYHGALYELLAAAHAGNYPDSLEVLTTLVNGRRLRDISDLPFDLAA